MTNAPNAPTVDDPFFGLSGYSNWIALVGTPSSEANYIYGYIEAAVTLANTVIEQRLHGSRDTLVMPILFTGRHALELALKFSIARLHGMRLVGSSYETNHDIVAHWTQLSSAAIGDRRIRSLVAQLEPFVNSLSRMDDDAQRFRYAETTSGDPSIPGPAQFDIGRIRDGLTAMGKTALQLIYRVFDLQSERRTGTHTHECSRSDLEAIAEMLGSRDTWTDP